MSKVRDMNILNSMDKLDAAAHATSLPNGATRRNAQLMVHAIKNIVKSMKQIVIEANEYEANFHIASDYDLQDETKIVCNI